MGMKPLWCPEPFLIHLTTFIRFKPARPLNDMVSRNSPGFMLGHPIRRRVLQRAVATFVAGPGITIPQNTAKFARLRVVAAP